MICEGCGIDQNDYDPHKAPCGIWCLWNCGGNVEAWSLYAKYGGNVFHGHFVGRDRKGCPNGCFDEPKPSVPDNCLSCGAVGSDPCKDDCPNKE